MKHLELWARWLWRRIERHRVLGLSAEVAFWLVLSLVPLATITGILVADDLARELSLQNEFQFAIPPAMRDFFVQELNHVATQKLGSLGPIALIAFFWFASSGIHAVFDAFGVVTGCTRRWWQKRIAALALCLALALFAGGSVYLIGHGGTLREVVSRLALGSRSGVQMAWRGLVTVGVVFLLVSSLYWLGLSPRVRARHAIMPGAAAATILQSALSLLYSLFLRFIGDGGFYVAELAGVAVIMTYVFLSVLAIMLGVLINSAWMLQRRASSGSYAIRLTTRATGHGTTLVR